MRIGALLLSLCFLVFLVFLVGCVSAPVRTDADLDIDAPDRWSAERDVEAKAAESAPESAPESEWWTLFGDPQLEQLVLLAQEQNRDLRAAAARVERAAAEARIAGADLQPDVSIGFEANRQRQVITGIPIPGQDDVLTSTASRAGLTFGVSWEADLWGRLRAAARASVADLQATEADRRGLALAVAAETARLWFGISEALEQIDLARRSVDAFRTQADQIRLRYEKGVRPAIDLRLALSNLARAEALVEARRSQLANLVRVLEVLLGRYPSGTLLAEYPAPPLRDAPPPVPVGLPAELIGRRPDLIAAERRLAAADQRVAFARRSLYPRLSLTAGGGTASNDLVDLVDGDFTVWSLAANLVQPLFQGGRLRAAVDRSEASAEEALQSFASTALLAYAEVEVSLVDQTFLRGQTRHIEEDVRQLVAAERLAEERYRAGVGDYLTLLEAQTRSVVSRSELLNLRRRRLENRVDLHLALGGGLEAMGPDPATLTATADGNGEDSP